MQKPLPADTWNNLFFPPPNYVFFENSAQVPFEPAARVFSWPNAWWLADAALLAYVKDWPQVNGILTAPGRFESALQIGADPAKSTKGFIAFRTGAEACAVVSYRGTDKDDPRNFRSDIDALPVERDGYTVDQGFARALDQVWTSEVQPALADFVRAHPGAVVYFTGHSLGAALATISVTRFDRTESRLYTIGSPRCGDDRFVRAVLAKALLVIRFVNGNEIVTQVPPEVPLQHYFRHVGLEMYIDRGGKLHQSPSDFLKWPDVAAGIAEHDGAAALADILHPMDYIQRLFHGPFVDPPPYLVGQHTPARYAIRIWNWLDALPRT